jgi:hypothetical protein
MHFRLELIADDGVVLHAATLPIESASHAIYNPPVSDKVDGFKLIPILKPRKDEVQKAAEKGFNS